jgi:hypothetical protein
MPIVKNAKFEALVVGGIAFLAKEFDSFYGNIVCGIVFRNLVFQKIAESKIPD